ncbi:hypothetical protein [uncultured Methanobrevibacter sp.]|uniref:hypothetical protein n=1 Tax=uncultured Methanobrevibacter sp. TaxID=253161 RepID=UPI0026372FF2|nr:hypothetical protein [uncultured Methanobrevibacter sp.]
MLKKTTILLAIFLVGLLAITASSAADNTTDASMAQDTTEIEMMNYEPADEILAAEDTPMLKAKEINVTGNSFKDIQNAILRADDGGTVYLDGITYFGDGNEIIVIKSINLIGKTGTVLDAQKKSRILYIQHDDVVLKDITFINGNTNDFGGAIFWDSSNAHILNCSFENNTATLGGANNFDKALTNSTINGNYNHNTADQGGANTFYGTLTNTTITGNYNHNTAEYGGGANHFEKALTNTTITATFINNRGSNTVYIQESDQSNIIKDSIFINNTGNNIRVKNGNIQVTNCWFGNTASNYNTDMTNSQGITTDNWYFLDITLNDTNATVS